MSDVSKDLSMMWLHLVLEHGDTAEEATRKVELMMGVAQDIETGNTQPGGHVPYLISGMADWTVMR